MEMIAMSDESPAGSELARRLKSGDFVVTAELTPPASSRSCR
jgi:hypothetical protein